MVAEPHKTGGSGVPKGPPGAAAAGGAAAGGGLMGWWAQFSSPQGPGGAMMKHLDSTVKQASHAAKKVKLSMPVDVKVDFFRPTVEAVRDGATIVWSQLPPPVQAAAPFVGAALGGGLVVFVIQQQRVGHQRGRAEGLQLQVDKLAAEKAELLGRINTLKASVEVVKSGIPRTEVEARLAAAVAQATNAAAAAAEAAARAATACVIVPSPGR